MKIGMAAFWAALPAMALAENHVVEPAAGQSLQAIIDAVAPGDLITLKPGTYPAPIVIGKSLTLSGEKGAGLVGNGKGSVITINAADVTVRNLTISGSGNDLTALDSGVLATETAAGAIIEDNVITGNLFGIYLHGAANSVAQRNTIVGLQGERLSEAGNGVSVWNAPGAKVLDNVISFGRDGIGTMASKRNVFSRNRFSDLRFGIHYMYTNDSEVSDNISTGNSVGYAIMFSNRLKITGNVSDGDRDHGLLLNYANASVITGNSVFGRLQPAGRWLRGGNRNADPDMPKTEDTVTMDQDATGLRPGPEKCVFIYNANKNRFTDNLFEGCAIGIHFTAGSEANAISGNAFINNRNQVKYVGTRYMDWSKDGRGNYWSDNPAFDLDGDGIADNPYRPNDLIDKVLWTAPQAKLLTTSPAVQVIRWAQAQFPALLPGGVVDSHPLMTPSTGKRQIQ